MNCVDNALYTGCIIGIVVGNYSAYYIIFYGIAL